MRLRSTLVILAAAAIIALAPNPSWSAGSPARLSAVVGQDITISLNSNPSTGFQWTLAKAPGGAVRIDKGTYEGGSGPDVAGAPGRQVFHARALARGTATLQFRYARQWEKGVAPARTFTLVVTVNPQTSATATSAQVFYCLAGDEFKVTLPSTPSTGYQWALSAGSFDESVITAAGSKYEADKSGRPGAAGKMTFRFKAAGPGTTAATMSYERKGVQAARVNTVLVEVAK